MITNLNANLIFLINFIYIRIFQYKIKNKHQID